MEFQMKNILCILALIFSSQAYSIDPTATFTEDDLTIYKQLNEALKLGEVSAEVKKEIIDQYDYTLSSEWYSWWLGNEDLDGSKFADHKVRFYDLIVTNNERIYNITFTYFPEAKQIYYTRKEFVYANSDDVLESFEEAKTNEELEKKHEADKFAFFKMKGYLDFTIYHIDGKEGMISYMDGGLINL